MKHFFFGLLITGKYLPGTRYGTYTRHLELTACYAGTGRNSCSEGILYPSTVVLADPFDTTIRAETWPNCTLAYRILRWATASNYTYLVVHNAATAVVLRHKCSWDVACGRCCRVRWRQQRQLFSGCPAVEKCQPFPSSKGQRQRLSFKTRRHFSRPQYNAPSSVS